ncbi:MAG: TonB-dependent receptor plug domain-containing protein, partial [Sphingomonas sp.]|nr:TonB-dependent receptor plug domain-containing protein [Sphingomonas sp.]
MKFVGTYSGGREALSSSAIKSILAGASSILALSVSAPAYAQAQPAATTLNASSDAALPQDASSGGTQASTAAGGVADPQNDQSDIIVTGLRGSLQRNLDIKRDAIGVVDAISSEDIGKFPDSNVAASLQRLPGVSIQRDGARGEATGVTVRGFGGDFNETLADGRRISTTNGGRSIDFSTVGSDFVGQLNVLKTPDVSLSSDSLGATVNILYPKPFDHPGLRIAASASGSYQDASKTVVPTGGLLFSDTFAGDTIGILADVAYSRHDTRSNQAYINGFGFGYYAPCQLQGSTAASCNPTSNPFQDAAHTIQTNPSDLTTVRGAFEQQYGVNQLYTKDERV